MKEFPWHGTMQATLIGATMNLKRDMAKTTWADWDLSYILSYGNAGATNWNYTLCIEPDPSEAWKYQ